ncbi:MAG: hypothetical protein V3V67_04065 [Myxococcota bacterium]
MLREPLLYLSLYFKQNCDEYYRLLGEVRRNGDWEAWLAFFLDGVRQTADGAVATVGRLGALFEEDERRIQERGRAAGSALRVHQVLKGATPDHSPTIAMWQFSAKEQTSLSRSAQAEPRSRGQVLLLSSTPGSCP